MFDHDFIRPVGNLILIGMLGLIVVSATKGQPRKVAKLDIEKLETAAEAKLEGSSYREKITKIGYRDTQEPAYYTSVMILEYSRLDRERMLYEEKDAKSVRRKETIEIGDTVYSRSNNGPWKKEKKRPVDFDRLLTPLGKIDETEVTVKYEYEYVGENLLSGILTDLYQVTTTRILPSGRGNIVNPSVKKFWFDRKGRLLKTQIDTTDNVSRGLHQEIVEYEYDVPIKIEAPIK